MGVPTSEVGYTPAVPRREDHEVHKRTCGGIGGKFFPENDGFYKIMWKNIVQLGRPQMTSWLMLIAC